MYLNSVLMHTGVPSAPGREDERFRCGNSAPEEGKTGQEYWNPHPSLPGLAFTPSAALTFAFTFTDDFLCYLVASAYVGIIRLRNHQLADRNMRSVNRKTHPVNGKNKVF